MGAACVSGLLVFLSPEAPDYEKVTKTTLLNAQKAILAAQTVR